MRLRASQALRASDQFNHFAVMDIGTVWSECVCASEWTAKGWKDLASRDFKCRWLQSGTSQLWQVFKLDQEWSGMDASYLNGSGGFRKEGTRVQ